MEHSSTIAVPPFRSYNTKRKINKTIVLCSADRFGNQSAEELLFQSYSDNICHLQNAVHISR